MHRLDKDTSGLMIVAKTQKAMQHFQNLFKQKTDKGLAGEDFEGLEKFYRAVVKADGQGKKFLEQAKVPFVIDEVVRPKNLPVAQHKRGVTVIEEARDLGNDLYFLNLKILTGRTHQIRYHLASK